MRRVLPYLVVPVTVLGCRAEEIVVYAEVPGKDTAAPAPVVAAEAAVARAAEDGAAARPRGSVDAPGGQALAAPEPAPHGADPVDDPELTDEYFEAVEAGQAVEPPPRPEGLPGDRAFSIGPPNGGWLIGGKPMPARGAHHRVLPGTLQRGWFYGTDALLGAIERAANAVGKAHGGAPLRVGNLSRAEGGKIGPSVSHQSGRDVDLGIYATDLDGGSVDPGGFPKFDGSRGDANIDTTGNYLFDVPRNWALVEALLSDSQVRVQWIFLDDPLRELLLDHAARLRANAELIQRAEKVIVRPRNSSPHANHFHVRLFCSAGDLEYGCKDFGPEWEWVKEDRAVEGELLDRAVDDVMSGRRTLDLLAPETADADALRVGDVMSGRRTLDLLAPETADADALRVAPVELRTPALVLPGNAPDDGPEPASPLDLPDPPTGVPLRD